MENPHVHILFHPTARILQKREACDIDIDAVINAKADEAGVKLVIDTDAHSLHHLGYMDYGIATARRGWATKADVLNTKPLKSFLGSLKK
jgi:DNA polymerase (family 10)